jgi:hypothetical protein
MVLLVLALAFPSAFAPLYPLLPARHWLPTIPLAILFLPTSLALSLYIADALCSSPPLDSPLALVTYIRKDKGGSQGGAVAAWLGGKNTMEVKEAPAAAPVNASAAAASAAASTAPGTGTGGTGTGDAVEVSLMLEQTDASSASGSPSASASSTISSSHPKPDASTTVAVYTPSLIQSSTTGLPPIGELPLDVVNEVLFGGC